MTNQYKKVYEHLDTGDLYQIADGAAGRQVSLSGEKTLTLVPATCQTGEHPASGSAPAGGTTPYALLNEMHALTLVVTRQELEKLFKPRTDLRCRGNTPLPELMKQYEAEMCNFTDAEHMIACALRLSDTMRDSQARCLLYSLARALQGFVSSPTGLPGKRGLVEFTGYGIHNQLLNELESLKDQARLRENDLLKDELTRTRAGSAAEAYAYCQQRLMCYSGGQPA